MASKSFHPIFSAFNRPLLIAHRGASGLFPENTLIAFKKAVEYEADIIELDVHLTKDEEIIVSHDTLPSRCTNKTGDKIWYEYTLEEIKTWDAGFHFTNPETPGVYPFRGQGIQIPTLREVFTECPSVIVNIDMKHHIPRTAELLLALIKECKAENRVIVCSMKEKMLERFRRLDSTIATGAGPSEVLKFYTLNKMWMSRLHTPRAHVYEIPHAALMKRFTGWGIGTDLDTRSFIDNAHSHGQKVLHWWSNTAEEINDLLDKGTDGVMTDRIDIGLEVFKKRGLK